jgi:hypothetical protein
MYTNRFSGKFRIEWPSNRGQPACFFRGTESNIPYITSKFQVKWLAFDFFFNFESFGGQPAGYNCQNAILIIRMILISSNIKKIPKREKNQPVGRGSTTSRFEIFH